MADNWGAESPVFEGSRGRLRKAAETFEEWLERRARAARRRYTKREWAAILKGPPPFTPEELAVVEARRLFRWRVIVVSEAGDLRFEVTTGQATGSRTSQSASAAGRGGWRAGSGSPWGTSGRGRRRSLRRTPTGTWSRRGTWRRTRCPTRSPRSGTATGSSGERPAETRSGVRGKWPPTSSQRWFWEGGRQRGYFRAGGSRGREHEQQGRPDGHRRQGRGHGRGRVGGAPLVVAQSGRQAGAVGPRW